MWSSIGHWLLAGRCALCLAPARAGLCPGCLGDLPRLGPACARCARPLANPTSLCGACQRRAPLVSAVHAPFRYAAPLDHLIQGLKFRAQIQHARGLGRLLAEHLDTRRSEPWPELIVPVPLHPARLRGRGYNQALELARPAARHLALPLVADACRRIRPTAQQTGLSAKARRANVRGAFELARPLPARHVAVVDDVMTTGHTLEAMAEALLRAGVERVEAWVLARA
ncbi:ComF family protein [Ectothiorhodospiraceae bacterium 2226]|nr:ComF family protein [Ectothiorhodospiraceae bacterium 2226]